MAWKRVDDSDDLSGAVRLRYRHPYKVAEEEGTLVASSAIGLPVDLA